MSNEHVHPVFGPILESIQAPFRTMEEMYDNNKKEKDKIRDRIISNLKQLDPEKSIMGDAISHAMNTAYNFENVVKLIIDQAVDNPDGMIHVIGNETLGLILKYDKM